MTPEHHEQSLECDMQKIRNLVKHNPEHFGMPKLETPDDVARMLAALPITNVRRAVLLEHIDKILCHALLLKGIKQ